MPIKKAKKEPVKKEQPKVEQKFTLDEVRSAAEAAMKELAEASSNNVLVVVASLGMIAGTMAKLKEQSK